MTHSKDKVKEIYKNNSTVHPISLLPAWYPESRPRPRPWLIPPHQHGVTGTKGQFACNYNMFRGSGCKESATKNVSYL